MATGTPGAAEATKTSWADLFRGGLARYTITLNLGVLLFGTDVYLIHGAPIDAAVDGDTVRRDVEI